MENSFRHEGRNSSGAKTTTAGQMDGGGPRHVPRRHILRKLFPSPSSARYLLALESPLSVGVPPRPSKWWGRHAQPRRPRRSYDDNTANEPGGARGGRHEANKMPEHKHLGAPGFGEALRWPVPSNKGPKARGFIGRSTRRRARAAWRKPPRPYSRRDAYASNAGDGTASRVTDGADALYTNRKTAEEAHGQKDADHHAHAQAVA